GMFRRLCELGLALIVSKLAIALALAVGAVALGADDGVGRPGGGLSLAGLMGGGTLMGLAAFTPFVVLRLLPLLETAVVAQGISRSPMRGAQTAMAASAYPVRLARLAVGPTGSATPTGPRALPAGSSIPLPSGAGGDRPVRPGQRPGGSAGPGRPSTAPAPWHPPHRPPRRPGRWS